MSEPTRNRVCRVLGWLAGITVVLLAMAACSSGMAPFAPSEVSPEGEDQPSPVSPATTVKFVYAPDAGPGAYPIGAMVDGEFWQECSHTNDVPPCWTYGTMDGTLYWPDGRVSRFQ